MLQTKGQRWKGEMGGGIETKWKRDRRKGEGEGEWEKRKGRWKEGRVGGRKGRRDGG